MYEDDESLSEFDLYMSNDLLYTEIMKQIQGINSVYQHKNFLDIFYQRYLLNRDNRETEEDENDPEAIETNNEIMEHYYLDTIVALKQTCGILIDEPTTDFDPRLINIIYSLFVFQLHSNIIAYISTVILTNKTMFTSSFEKVLKASSDISYKMARKTFKNKIDAIIVSKINEIIDIIIYDDNLLNPEVILELLYKNNPEDYECREVYNLFQIVYLSFDIHTFQSYIRNIYNNPDVKTNIRMGVIEWILPTLKKR